MDNLIVTKDIFTQVEIEDSKKVVIYNNPLLYYGVHIEERISILPFSSFSSWVLTAFRDCHFTTDEILNNTYVKVKSEAQVKNNQFYQVVNWFSLHSIYLRDINLRKQRREEFETILKIRSNGI